MKKHKRLAFKSEWSIGYLTHLGRIDVTSSLNLDEGARSRTRLFTKGLWESKFSRYEYTIRAALRVRLRRALSGEEND